MIPKQEEYPSSRLPQAETTAKGQGSSFSRLTVHHKQLLSITVAALVFIATVLKINHRLFASPINEYYDFASFTLQIEDAKHFHTLLGHYSQWGFHHPGPAFFYLLALGELILHDWSRIVPEVMNAQLVTIIIFNSVLLFTTLAIFGEHSASRLFTPAAVISSLYFIYVVNRSAPGTALTSVWISHILLFLFLLFATACASVSSGTARHLTIMTFAGLMLLHGHVAQPIFVGPLAVLALTALWFSCGKQVGFKSFLRVNCRTLWICAALIVAFAFPIVLEAVIHRPNNLQRILVHVSTHPAWEHGWGRALKYEASFLTFIQRADVVLENPSAHLISRGGSQPYVAVYWCVYAFLAGLTVATLIHRRTALPAFIKWLMIEIVVIVLLFFYWSTRISGPQSTFHGYFFYSVQLLFVLAMVSTLLDGAGSHLSWVKVTALSCAASLLVLLAKPSFRTTETGLDETDQMIASLPADLGLVRFQFPHDDPDWYSIVGVASHLKRTGHPFCVTDNYWAHFFGREMVCGTDMTTLTNLIFTRGPRKCDPPCRTLIQGPSFSLQLSPYSWLNVPFRIENDGSNSLNENFFWDSGGLWSTKKSTIHFLLASDFNKDLVKIRITGSVIPWRPVDVFLNGKQLGSVTAGQSIADFVVEGRDLLPGKENALTFEDRNAGPVLHDWRELGFFITSVEFDELEARNH